MSKFESASPVHAAEIRLDGEAASVMRLLPARLQEEVQKMLHEQRKPFNPSASSSTSSNDQSLSTLTEIHIDEGRPAKLRFRDRPAVLLPIKVPVAEALGHLVRVKEQVHNAQETVQQDSTATGGLDTFPGRQVSYHLGNILDEGSSKSSKYALKGMSAGQVFGSDGRMALPGALHRFEAP
eukprot:scaffold33507_cov18-Tisochrysis_lutea.AAC.2